MRSVFVSIAASRFVPAITANLPGFNSSFVCQTFAVVTRRGRSTQKACRSTESSACTNISPLSVPVLLEIGREKVYGEASDVILAEAADELIKEAMQ